MEGETRRQVKKTLDGLLSGLESLHVALERLQADEKQLNKQVALLEASQKSRDKKRDKLMKEAELSLQSITNRKSTLEQKILEIKEGATNNDGWEDLAQKATDLDRTATYMGWIKKIDSISKQMEESSQNSPEMRNHYNDLLDICSKLESSQCNNLRNYAKKQAQYWHDNLTVQLTTSFQDVLKEIGWPKVEGISTTAQKKFESLFLELLKFEAPSSKRRESHSSSTALTQLLIPIQHRFQYHFIGKENTSPTKRNDRPEWPLTFLRKTYEETNGFLFNRVQPLLKSEVQALEFMGGALVDMATACMAERLSEVIEDDELLANTLQEMIKFDRWLFDACPLVSFGCCRLLRGNPDLVDHWIELQGDCVAVQIESIFNNTDAWQPAFTIVNDIDKQRPPKAAVEVLILISAMTELYAHIPYHDIQLRFLTEIQLPTIEDFLTRSQQRVVDDLWDHPPAAQVDRLTMIVNSLDYVRVYLREWEDDPVLLLMQPTPSVSSSDDNDNRVADGTDVGTDLLETQINEVEAALELATKELCGTISMLVKRSSRAYINESWTTGSMAEQPISSPDVTPSLSPTLRLLHSVFAQLRSSLSENLIEDVMIELADMVDRFFFEEVVLVSKISAQGAAQLRFDFVKTLSPLFQPSSQPVLTLCREACTLLSLDFGTWNRLRGLTGMTTKEVAADQAKSLRDVGVNRFLPKTAKRVLDRHVDHLQTLASKK